MEWLRRGQINWDGERVIINAQDQGHYTHAFKKIVGLSQSDKCRFCGVETESTSHLFLGCKKLMLEQLYTGRPDSVCRVLHWHIYKHFNILVPEQSWKHNPNPILKREQVILRMTRLSHQMWTLQTKHVRTWCSNTKIKKIGIVDRGFSSQ